MISNITGIPGEVLVGVTELQGYHKCGLMGWPTVLGNVLGMHMHNSSRLPNPNIVLVRRKRKKPLGAGYFSIFYTRVSGETIVSTGEQLGSAALMLLASCVLWWLAGGGLVFLF